MLLENNPEAALLQWTIDQCYSTKPSCARLCFHAISNVFGKMYVQAMLSTVVYHVFSFQSQLFVRPNSSPPPATVQY